MDAKEARELTRSAIDRVVSVSDEREANEMMIKMTLPNGLCRFSADCVDDVIKYSKRWYPKRESDLGKPLKSKSNPPIYSPPESADIIYDNWCEALKNGNIKLAAVFQRQAKNQYSITSILNEKAKVA